MKICHIYPFFPPRRLGGVEKWIISLSNFLSESTTDIHFFLLTDRSNFYYYAVSPKISRYGSLQVYRVGPNIFSSIFYSSRIKWKIFEKLSLMEAFKETATAQPARNADIFHLHGVWLSKEFKQYMKLAFLLSHYFNKPLVVSLHNDVSNVSKDSSLPLFNPEVRNFLRIAKAITTYSPDVFRILHELDLGSKSYFIPNFIDTEKFKCPYPRDYSVAKRVIFVSRLDPEKDPVTVIKAFKYVKEKVPDSSLTIIGSGSMYRELQNLILKLKLTESVFLKGQRMDVRKFLWNSDIFVSAPSGYITLLEAWAAGIPVLACDDGIFRQIISHGKNGILFKLHDPKELSQALVYLMENEDLRRELSLAGMQTVRYYDIRNIAPKIRDIYRFVMDEKL